MKNTIFLFITLLSLILIQSNAQNSIEIKLPQRANLDNLEEGKLCSFKFEIKKQIKPTKKSKK